MEYLVPLALSLDLNCVSIYEVFGDDWLIVSNSHISHIVFEKFAAGQEIGGTLPVELFRLNTLRVLSLEFNDIGGTIPTQIGSLPRLTTVRLNNNNLQGDVPSELGNASFLTTANLQANNLDGVMPSQVCDLGTLESLVVDCDEVVCDGCCTSCCINDSCAPVTR